MIAIKDIVSDTYTNATGFSLYTVLKPLFEQNKTIELSFDGVTATSSSFLNSSFGILIEDFGMEKFKDLVRPVHITKGEADIIKKFIAGFRYSSNSNK